MYIREDTSYFHRAIGSGYCLLLPLWWRRTRVPSENTTSSVPDYFWGSCPCYERTVRLRAVLRLILNDCTRTKQNHISNDCTRTKQNHICIECLQGILFHILCSSCFGIYVSTSFGGFALTFAKGWLLTLVMLTSIPLLVMAGAAMALIVTSSFFSGTSRLCKISNCC